MIDTKCIYTTLATLQPCEFVAQLVSARCWLFPYLTRVRVLHGKQVFKVEMIAFMFQISYLCKSFLCLDLYDFINLNIYYAKRIKWRTLKTMHKKWYIKWIFLITCISIHYKERETNNLVIIKCNIKSKADEGIRSPVVWVDR